MTAPFHDWDILISEERITARVRELGMQISSEFEGNEFTIVCVLNGAIFFAVDLLRQFAFETKGEQVRLDVVKARSYVGTESGEIAIDMTMLNTGLVTGKHVLLIDDILDTGQTLFRLTEKLRELQPASLRTAVLLKKQDALDSRFALTADFVGFEVPKEAFVVGYGLDYEGRYRNLQDIRLFGDDSA